MKKLNHIWVFSDGIAGHEIQSTALASQLAHNVSLFHCSIRQPWLSFAPRILPRFGRNIIWQMDAPDTSQPPDAIMTCGRRMAAIGKYFKRQCQCKHIQILNPGDASVKYDVLICPEHDGLQGTNIITTKGSLHSISEQVLAEKKVACLQHNKSLSNKSVTVFLGNPAKGFYQDLYSLASQIKHHYTEFDLYICGSRRTHNRYHKSIRKHFKGAKQIWLSEKDGVNPYACLLACSAVFIVTADSVNMVSEVCATDKPVLAIAQDFISPKHQKFIESISDRLTSFGKQTSDITPLNTLTQTLTEIEKLIYEK